MAIYPSQFITNRFIDSNCDQTTIHSLVSCFFRSFPYKQLNNRSHDVWPWWPLTCLRAALFSDSSDLIFMVSFSPAGKLTNLKATSLVVKTNVNVKTGGFFFAPCLWPQCDPSGVTAGAAEGGRGERPCAGQADPGREARAEDGALPRKGDERESWAAAHFRTTEQRSDSRLLGLVKGFL